MPRIFDGELAPLGSADEPSVYYLPCPSNIVESLKGMDPWLAHIAQLDKNIIHKLLSSWWANISHPPLAELRNRLLEFDPVAIVVFDELAHLRIDSPRKNGNRSIFIGSPSEDVRIREALGAWIPGDLAFLYEFYKYLPRLCDISPDVSGGFIQPPDWERFEEFGWPLSNDEEAWAASAVLFNACNGDLLLLSNEGVAWAVLSTGQISKICDTFSTFIQLYTRFLRTSTSLDYFSFSKTIKN